MYGVSCFSLRNLNLSESGTALCNKGCEGCFPHWRKNFGWRKKKWRKKIFNNKPFHFGFYENRNWESCHFRSLNGRFCSVSDFTLLLFKSPFSFILTISILSRPFHLRLLTSSSPTHVPVNTQHFHCLNLWPCPTPDLHPHSHCILSKPINLKP